MWDSVIQMAMSDTVFRVEAIVHEFQGMLAPLRKEYDATLAGEWKELDPVATCGVDTVFNVKLPDEGASLDKLIVDRLKEVVTPPWTLSISIEFDPDGSVLYKLRAVPLETRKLFRTVSASTSR
jgi:hypothetical protein